MNLRVSGDEPVDTAAEIRRVGFRRWYERKLVAGHLFLVSALLGIILIAVGLETFGAPVTVLDYLGRYGLALGGAALCVYAGTRYWQCLTLAERFGNHATCRLCKSYGLLDVVSIGISSADEHQPGTGGWWLQVRCRRCGHTWKM